MTEQSTITRTKFILQFKRTKILDKICKTTVVNTLKMNESDLQET